MMSKGVSESVVLIFLVFSSATCGSVSSFEIEANYQLQVNATGSTIYLPAHGNVYPLGYYYVSLTVGKSPTAKAYTFDVDSGSGLTWLECDPGGGCVGCIMPRARQYKPKASNVVKCKDPRCKANYKHWPSKPPKCSSDTPEDQCDYAIEYAEGTSSHGVLVEDFFGLPLVGVGGRRTTITPIFAFGCAYDQQYVGGSPNSAGLLGIGKGKGSILSQLLSQNKIANFVGHCFSKRGGFVFFGDGIVHPTVSVTWVPMLTSTSFAERYIARASTIFVGGRPTGINNLDVIFDTGSTNTYFNARNYEAIFDLITKNLRGKPLMVTKEPQFEVCWKPTDPSIPIATVISYFTPLSIAFTNSGNVRLHVQASEYLVVTTNKNVCLGIENGTRQRLGDLNLIGDTFMQNKVMIYDNERGRIGWFPNLLCA